MIYDSRMVLQVRTDCLITFAQNCYGFQLTELQKAAMKARMLEAAKTRYKGNFSAGARKRIGRAIDLLIQISKPRYGINEVTGKRQRHQLSYITLTIPGETMITAEEGYHKLLKHFLQWLRRTKKAGSYVWKAELQERGQLHYHITTPAWIHYQEIKDKWNNLLRSNGFTEKYHKEHGHHNPNSTDVHEVYQVKNLAAYLKKEFCKAVQNHPTAGKIWDCSVNLKDNGYFELELDLQLINNIYKDVQAGKLDVVELDQCRIYKAADKRRVQEPLTLQQIQTYKSYIEHVSKYERSNNKPAPIQNKNPVSVSPLIPKKDLELRSKPVILQSKMFTV